MAPAGYSGTPLAKKLGIKDNYRIRVYNCPMKYEDFFEDFPTSIIFDGDGEHSTVDFIHIFSKDRSELTASFHHAKPLLKKDGIIWISWPKKTSGIATELDKFYVMNFGKEGGLVDTKVAAIDENWSGHKFVYRLINR